MEKNEPQAQEKNKPTVEIEYPKVRDNIYVYQESSPINVPAEELSTKDNLIDESSSLTEFQLIVMGISMKICGTLRQGTLSLF